MKLAILSLCFVSLSVAVHGKSDTCTPWRNLLGEIITRAYCASSERFKNEGEEKSAQYEKCISRKVKELAPQCLTDPSGENDYRKLLCTSSEKTEAVKEAICCIGKIVESMNFWEIISMYIQTKTECEPKS